TVVPDTFRVLLSQRRRWINSTVHNLAELILVRDLCGTFCFSMQFIVGMDLAGTLVLPAAISFTLYLIIESIVPNHANTTIPLILLAIILGLPGLLIVGPSRGIRLPMKRILIISCRRAKSNRYSSVADSDTFHPPSNNGFDSSTTESSSYASPRQRHDSNTLLMLPVPLSVNRQPQPPPMASSSSLSINGARSSEEHQYTDTSSSNLRLIPSFQSQSDQQHLTDHNAPPAGIAPPSRYSSPGARSMESPQPRANFRSPTGFSE
ncbi:chitin synthase-domain-containing protein, partial [Lentinula aff. detonsa]